MPAVSCSEVFASMPHLAEKVLAKLVAVSEGRIDPEDIEWVLVECHDEVDQPLDEAACADVLLTCSLPSHRGVAGRFGDHYACFCEEHWISSVGRP